MQIFAGLDGLRQIPDGAVVSVGNFDGLHLGHRKILETARSLDQAGRGVAVVTFEPHPLTVLRPDLAPPRLTPLTLKRDWLREAGVNYLVELPPTKDVLGVTAEEFLAILRDDVRPAHLVEGGNFTFGRGRGGTVEKLREWAAGTGVRLHVADPVTAVLSDLTVVPVSSSLVRWLLAHGRARDAAVCLARPYTIEGVVVQGYQRGRTIGVPTANLRVTDQLIPPDAVYAGRCTVAGRAYPAAVSIGSMPTFGAGQRHQLEAHLVGFAGDLYGQALRVELLDYLRDQRKYPELEQLKRQIARDVEAAVGRARVGVGRSVA